MRFRVWLVLLGALLAVATFSPAWADDGTITVALKSINDSGISGTARLVPRGNQTEVIIGESSEPGGASEPVHIHLGPCTNLDPQPTYPLKNVEQGKSDTLVNVPIGQLTTGHFAVNVHESAAKIGTYVACGDIPLRGATPSTIVWAAKAGLPTPRSDLGLASLGDRIFAIGGATSGREFVPTVEEYNPTQNAWTARTRMPTARSNLAVATSNGKIYAIGGSTTGRDYLATVEMYDPATNTWALKANLPTARADLGVATDKTGKIYAIGGMTDGRKIVATVEAYDPATNAWTARASLPSPRADLGVVAASDGKIYAIGGTSNGREYLATVDAYDPASNTWTARASMPTARSLLGVAASNGRVYAVGGAATGFEYVGTVEEYDPATNTWVKKGDLPTPRSSLAAVGAANGKIYAIGGCCNGADLLSTVEEAAITIPAPAPSPTTVAVAPVAPTAASASPTAAATPASEPSATTAATAVAPATVVSVPTAAPAPASSPVPAPASPAGGSLPILPIAAGGVLVGAGLVGGAVISRRRAGAAPAPPSPTPPPGPATPPPVPGAFPTPNPSPPPIGSAPTGAPPSWPTNAPPSWPRPMFTGSYPPGVDQPTMVAPVTGSVDLSPLGYQISGPPKQGGMASVFKAYQPALDRNVAIKVLSPILATDPVFVQRFYEEARRTAKLEHPNIVPIYDIGQAPNGCLFIVMRYIEGLSLQEVLAHEHPLGLDRATRIASQVADALEYAHNHGVVHRDVKPSNVMIEASDRATLMDFGIAKIVGDSQLTRAGVVVGTPKYLSPEQAAGEQADNRSDVYSLGIVLYEMLAGRAPFEAENSMALLHAHTILTPPPPTQFNPSVPPGLVAVVLKALEKDRAHRYATAAAFLADLRAAAAAPSQ